MAHAYRHPVAAPGGAREPLLGLYFVYKDKGNSNRAVIALTIRVAVSVLVFAILIAPTTSAGSPSAGCSRANQEKSRTEVRLFLFRGRRAYTQ
jgi:hypothetical protein